MNDADKVQSTWWETCPSASLCTTNPKYTALGLNTGLHSEKPITRHLNVTCDACKVRVVVTGLDIEKICFLLYPFRIFNSSLFSPIPFPSILPPHSCPSVLYIKTVWMSITNNLVLQESSENY